MNGKEDFCDQQRNPRVEPGEPEPPQIKVKQEEPEPPRIKDEQEEPEPPRIKDEQEEPEPPQIKVKQEEPEPPRIKEEQEEPEPPQIKEKPGELCISQDEEQLDLKQETETLMEIPALEEHVDSEADGNNQQSGRCLNLAVNGELTEPPLSRLRDRRGFPPGYTDLCQIRPCHADPGADRPIYDRF
ncbi:protein FAM47A-like [Oryzias melastigma]|uniref:protein FAM47A-like n=1 Tax=Oryzias melastigma TaxID=30732 RepID=UPI000CF7C310|nr:protein FAM47A-like [Oryzias melastigma]